METSEEIGQGDILFAPAGGSSHYRDVGRILFWKRTRPTPRKKSTRAFRLALDPNDTKGRDCDPSLLDSPPGN